MIGTYLIHNINWLLHVLVNFNGHWADCCVWACRGGSSGTEMIVLGIILDSFDMNSANFCIQEDGKSKENDE